MGIKHSARKERWKEESSQTITNFFVVVASLDLSLSFNANDSLLEKKVNLRQRKGCLLTCVRQAEQ